MKVLIAGANGYIGRHVAKLFKEQEFDVFAFSRDQADHNAGIICADSEEFVGCFDVVINCARPHWSEFSPDEIAITERLLLGRLEQFASPRALKIHTSGVWLFGKASKDDLISFTLRPFEAVKPDVATIESVLQQGWNIVYCPSLVYGGENCQLRRCIEALPSNTIQLAMPSIGFNQYIHVADIAKFYLSLLQTPLSQQQHFIAEPKGYSPQAFAELLLTHQVVSKVDQVDWLTFESIYGHEATQVEKLNLNLPVSGGFKPSYSVEMYIKNY